MRLVPFLLALALVSAGCVSIVETPRDHERLLNRRIENRRLSARPVIEARATEVGEEAIVEVIAHSERECREVAVESFVTETTIERKPDPPWMRGFMYGIGATGLASVGAGLLVPDERARAPLIYLGALMAPVLISGIVSSFRSRDSRKSSAPRSRESVIRRSRCDRRPLANAAISIQLENGSRLAHGITDENGRGEVRIPLVVLLDRMSRPPYDLNVANSAMEFSELANLRDAVAVRGAQEEREARRRASQDTIHAWHGKHIGLPVAGATLRSAQMECERVGLSWEPVPGKQTSYNCTSSSGPVPRHLGGQPGSKLTYEFDAEGRVVAARYYAPRATEAEASRDHMYLLMETIKLLGESRKSGGLGPTLGVNTWRVADPSGGLWDWYVGIVGHVVGTGYERVLE